MPTVTLHTEELRPGDKVILASPDAEAADLKQLKPEVVETVGVVNSLSKSFHGIRRVIINLKDGTVKSVFIDYHGQTSSATLQLFKLGRRRHRRTVLRVDYSYGPAQIH